MISAIAVSSRATSGSGLVVANPVLSEWISARTVSWIDSTAIASGESSYPWIWTGRPLLVGLFPLPVGPGGARHRHDNRPASVCNKTRFFHGKARIIAVNRPYTKLHSELEITPNLITDQSTLINGDSATKIRRFLRLSYAEMEIPVSQQETETD